MPSIKQPPNVDFRVLARVLAVAVDGHVPVGVDLEVAFARRLGVAAHEGVPRRVHLGVLARVLLFTVEVEVHVRAGGRRGLVFTPPVVTAPPLGVGGAAGA